jgi:hypothetical protein
MSGNCCVNFLLCRDDPDVVCLRLHPKPVMIRHDVILGMRMEGKPQCHIAARSQRHVWNTDRGHGRPREGTRL